MQDQNQSSIICQQCHIELKPKQFVLMLWKKKKKVLTLCLKCASDFYEKEVKDTEITNKQILNTHFWGLGARAIDFKSYLHKWAKELKNRL